MAQYVNVGGAARRVTGRYVRVDGVARRVQTAYTAVSGTARRYFAPAGVAWRKWSCRVETVSFYTQVDYDGVTHVGDTKTFEQVTANSIWFTSHSGWTWSESTGFSGDYADYRKVSPEEIVGRYNAVDTELRQFTDCVDHGDGTYDLTWECIGLAVEDGWDTYGKGTELLGVVSAGEGELPEDGEPVEGSADGSYCIVLVDGVHYYYEKVTE